MVVLKTGDKVTGFEPGGRGFGLLQSRHIFKDLRSSEKYSFLRNAKVPREFRVPRWQMVVGELP